MFQKMDYHCGLKKRVLNVHILQLQSYRQQRCKLLFTCARLLEECTLLKVETLAIPLLEESIDTHNYEQM